MINTGIGRVHGVAPHKKKALTLDRLQRVISCILPDFAGTRDRALLLVGWTAALRRSELCALRFEDLEEQSQGIVLTLRRSKTDQAGKSRKIGLPFVDQEPRLCACRALRKWLLRSQITEGYIFRGIGRKKEPTEALFFAELRTAPLNDRMVSLIVKRAVARAGYDPAEYAGHSLRSGLATTLASVGISERRIAKITGHSSLETLRGYIQDGGVFLNHPVTDLFSSFSGAAAAVEVPAVSTVSDPDPNPE